MPTLRRCVPLIVAVCLFLPPQSARAWDAQAGSPPAWQSHWVQSTEPVDVFASADGDASAAAWPSEPREYLYARAPELAPRLDCIIAGESGWDPTQQNPRSHAAGLAQFLPSTWATTPEGQHGLSPFDPIASIDAAIWLAQTIGFGQWQVYARGMCR